MRGGENFKDGEIWLFIYFYNKAPITAEKKIIKVSSSEDFKI